MQQERGLVSVIIPTWNRSHCIENAIKSVINQTYTNLEVLVCDDGSTDGTANVVKKLAKIDSRVIWLEETKNSGLPGCARNRGIKKSRGEWVAFLDSDDLWVSNKIEKQLQICLEKDINFICNEALIMHSLKKENNFLINRQDHFFNLNQLAKGNIAVCSSVMIKKSVLGGNLFFSEKRSLKAFEDYNLWLKYLANCDAGYFHAEPLTIYKLDSVDSVRGSSEYENNIKKFKILHKDVSEYLINLGQEEKIDQLKPLLLHRTLKYFLRIFLLNHLWRLYCRVHGVIFHGK